MNSSTQHIYLEKYLAPLATFLARSDVTDIYINQPGEVWLEAYKCKPERHNAPDLTRDALHWLVRQIAAYNAQGINRAHPLLAASLPSGERIQVVMPPATRGEIAIAIRKHVVSDLTLEDFMPATEYPEVAEMDSAAAKRISREPGIDTELFRFFRQSVLDRRNILVSGSTSSGKTTFLNTLIGEIPQDERLIFIEDTPELNLVHDNAIGLVAARGALRETEIDAGDLLIAALRMRPDRIILGEIRGREAVTFLRAINTGHPGSMTTIHADSPQGAIEQLAFLALQAGMNLSWDDMMKYIQSSIDISIHMRRSNGNIVVSSVLFT